MRGQWWLRIFHWKKANNNNKCFALFDLPTFSTTVAPIFVKMGERDGNGIVCCGFHDCL